MARGGRVGLETAAEPLVLPSPVKPSYTRCVSHAADELHSFRSCLRWMCVDQSNWLRASLSWGMFLVLGVVVPLVSHFVLSYSPQRHPYNAVVQFSLTAVSGLSFVCLSGFVRRYGLRRFLYLDKLRGESEKVRFGYISELNGSFLFLSYFVLPCFAADCGYKVWWYCTGSGRIPFLGNPIASDLVACALELVSWLYRTCIYFLVCVLFRLACHLQILRLQDFSQVFQEESDVATVLSEHLRIRRQLRVISHRFRFFIVACLFLVSASQLATLLLTTRHTAHLNIFNTGELAIASVELVTGILVCLRSAVKITHKAQAIKCHAAKWHVCATIDSFNDADAELPSQHTSNYVHPTDESDSEVGDEDELEETKLVHPNINTISFQKRQALVTYLENNTAGITVFGFMMDRSYLYMIFGLEFSMVLWLLGKTVGIS